MQCPRCKAENREGRRFCAECGTSLAFACPSCGFSNEPGEKFCGGCGTPLLSARRTAELRFSSPQTYTPRHLAEKILTSRSALEGERKQVTVLFADLKGSMELLADRDPEEARKLLDPVLERMMEAVHRYEGTVNQVMGDGIMALFGAPLAHEDHAVRACYAALRMQESVSRYGDEIQRSHGVPLQIRIGLNSGEVVVRSIASDLRMDYTAVGQTPHLAARMEQMAKPGSVLVTAQTFELAEGYVRVKPLGPVPVKGLEAPIGVYDLIGAAPARSRLHAAAARGLSRFIGRDAEMEQLRRALEQAREGRGQAAEKAQDLAEGRGRGFVLLGDLSSLMGDLNRANQSYEKALEGSSDASMRRWIANKRHRSHTVVRAGARIAFYEHGSGDITLVLSHPLIYGLATFQPVIEKLCQEFRIITIDPRGTGRSDPLQRPYSLKEHMEDARAVIEAAASGPIVAVGLSRGCRLLVKLVVAYPSLVQKLVLVGSPAQAVTRLHWFSEARESLGHGDMERALRILASVVFSEPETNDLAEQFVRSGLRLPTETVLSFFDPDPEQNIEPLLPNVRVPTLVMHGTADRTIPFEAGRYVVDHIPEAHFYAFEGRGHLPVFTATSEFREVLRCFVRTGGVPETIATNLLTGP